MSANRLIAHQRLTAAIAAVFNVMPVFQPVMQGWTVDAVDNEDESTTTVGINPESGVLVFNREWVACQEDSQLRAAIYHLALGIVMDHLGRRGDRHRGLWTMANAYVNNALIQQEIEKGTFPKDFITFPQGSLIDPRFGAAAKSEEVYEVLLVECPPIHVRAPALPPEALDEIRRELRAAVIAARDGTNA